MTQRIVAIEGEGFALRAEQAAAQGALQQGQPQQRLVERDLRRPAALLRPAGFDLANTLDHQPVVIAVRSAMQRQAQADDCAVAGRQQQAVAAKIVEADPLAPRSCRTGDRKQLLPSNWRGQQVVALQAGIVIRPIVAVDRAKRQAAGAAGPRRRAGVRSTRPLDMQPQAVRHDQQRFASGAGERGIAFAITVTVHLIDNSASFYEAS